MIKLAHGGGGQLTVELIEQVILPSLKSTQNPAGLTDAATLDGFDGKLAFTTDSYVIQPLEFPGGDIGELAVFGTVNDLAVAGAKPKALSMGLILEEGLEIALLKRVLESAGKAAQQAGVAIVTGDTKVVEHGGVDGIIINTAGIGAMIPEAELGFDRIAEGDVIILSGALGEHGLAVMSQREGLSFTAELESDCAAINCLTESLLAELGSDVKFMRDPTRSGLAATLVEVSEASGFDVELDETAIPLNKTARAAAEMLGLDLLSVANEGKLVAIVTSETAQRAVEILQREKIAAKAAVVGRICSSSDAPIVEMITSIGGRRIVQMPYGEELPRIC